MGVDAEKVGRILVATGLFVFHCVCFFMSVTQVEGLLRLALGHRLVVFERVPSPVRHGGQRHSALVEVRVALQSGNVYRCCNVAVAHRVGTGDDWVVARHHCLAVYGLCGVVGVVSQRFHLERSPDERAHSLGVVVAHRLREIVVVRAVAAQVGLLHVLCYGGARARAGHGATVGQRDSAVGVDLDEVVDDSAVSAYSRVAVFGSEVAFSVCLEQRVGKHGRACRLEIVAFAPRAVHHLIPHPGLLVLPFYHGIEVFLE